MRISDWSSDVCSSDLPFAVPPAHPARRSPGAAIDGQQDAGDVARHGARQEDRGIAAFPIDALAPQRNQPAHRVDLLRAAPLPGSRIDRSEEHTSELQSLMRISYAVFCLQKKKTPYSIRSSKAHLSDNTTQQ